MYLISAIKQLITWLLPIKCSPTCALYFLGLTEKIGRGRVKITKRTGIRPNNDGEGGRKYPIFMSVPYSLSLNSNYKVKLFPFA